ncbi:LLM class flavin-dependent oxidoreductase [Aeromicrobium endophyticum]|uniref:LLM class flavin-dependent oxidoreductase n=1 Tax=Aeromicrobium endophyticum TaxID=2292704 RepID=A0A371NZ01_9ACTN|nr:LLM class flavin-dependent oxidoreductase [Aeromicrobium endophyticum]REK68912.1 LLM class flavin-dependent oxidoreductase [Aeromicrobium endophyticum]
MGNDGGTRGDEPTSSGTSAPVLVALVAAATSGGRVGSGAVLLPHHSPLELAEQLTMHETRDP